MKKGDRGKRPGLADTEASTNYDMRIRIYGWGRRHWGSYSIRKEDAFHLLGKAEMRLKKNSGEKEKSPRSLLGSPYSPALGGRNTGGEEE